jgi:hypothetical protein
MTLRKTRKRETRPKFRVGQKVWLNDRAGKIIDGHTQGFDYAVRTGWITAEDDYAAYESELSRRWGFQKLGAARLPKKEKKRP